MKTGKPIGLPEHELRWRMIELIRELERQEGRVYLTNMLNAVCCLHGKDVYHRQKTEAPDAQENSV